MHVSLCFAWMAVSLVEPAIAVEPPKLTGRAVENSELFQREIDQAAAARGEAPAGGQRRLQVSVDEDARDYAIRFELFDASGTSVAKAETSCDICAETEAAALTGRELAAFLAANPAVAGTTVRITSEPAGATVLVDGNEVGTTPYEGSIEPGPHTVALRHDGYDASSREFDAAEGKTSEMHVDLVGRAPKKAPASPPSDKTRRGLWIGGWAGIGVGVALLTTGIALLAIDGNEIKSDCSGANVDAFGTCKYRYETTGGGAAATVLGVAFAGVGTGLVVWARPRKNGAHLKADLSPTRVGMTLRF